MRVHVVQQQQMSPNTAGYPCEIAWRRCAQQPVLDVSGAVSYYNSACIHGCRIPALWGTSTAPTYTSSTGCCAACALCLFLVFFFPSFCSLLFCCSSLSWVRGSGATGVGEGRGLLFHTRGIICTEPRPQAAPPVIVCTSAVLVPHGDNRYYGVRARLGCGCRVIAS